MKADDIPFKGATPTTGERVFRERGEQKYSLEVLDAGIEIMVDRLRRQSRELWGELSVKVNGQFKNAQTIDGIVSIADFNFSSAQARSARASLISKRAAGGTDDYWAVLFEEFAIKVLAAERAGKPAVVLADEDDSDDSKDTWNLEGWPILREHPMVLFGSGGSGKSYLAIWVAGSLAALGVNVLYADWEFSIRDHRRRFGQLFQPMPKGVLYVRCDKPIKDEIERLMRLIVVHKIQYVICDSMVFALEGAAESSEQAGIYFRAIRQLKVGTLSLAHTTKSEDDSEKQLFGSVFFSNGARSVWFIQRATENPSGRLRMGLYHRKSNVGELLKPKGFELVFSGETTRIESVAVDSVDELAAKLPLLDRIKKGLAKGALPPKKLALDLGTTEQAIRSVVSRHGSLFVYIGPKLSLTSQSAEF